MRPGTIGFEPGSKRFASQAGFFDGGIWIFADQAPRRNQPNEANSFNKSRRLCVSFKKTYRPMGCKRFKQYCTITRAYGTPKLWHLIIFNRPPRPQ